MIRLGYVGINTELPTASKTFRLASYSEERMLQVSRDNLNALQQILFWNFEHGIHLFRITSGLIPFGSHPINSSSWKKVLQKELETVGKYINKNNIRVSMHPGQYTVLNTPNPNYFANSLRDVQYHADVLDLLGVNSNNKIILHGGGVYGEKEKYTRVLIKRIGELPKSIRKRLVLENDERNYSAEDILAICREVELPGVFDVFHHQVKLSLNDLSLREIILLYKGTWHGKRQKIHYSNQAPDKNRGAHSQSIDINEFGKLLEEIRNLDLDIMLEGKDKQASVLRLHSRFPELK